MVVQACRPVRPQKAVVGMSGENGGAGVRMIKRFVIWNGIEGLFLSRLGGFRQWTNDVNEALLIPGESTAKEIAEKIHKISGYPVVSEAKIISQANIVEKIERAKKDLAGYCAAQEILDESDVECVLTRFVITKERALIEMVIAGINNDLALLAADLAESSQA